MPVRFTLRAAIIVIAGFAAYAAGLRNRYALDDDLVLGSNIAVQRGIAECLGLPDGTIRVISPDVGGGFGYKGLLCREEVALAWLARHTGGQFILRVEDTDRSRFDPNALDALYESLEWLGMDWDEGPRMDPVPALGEHTEAILRELGVDADGVRSLRAAEAI